MKIDIERLREDIMQDSYGACFVGGYGGALIDSFDVENASAQELIDMAESEGIDLRKYEIGRYW